MDLSLKDVYPLGINTTIKGTRRLVREKVLQILTAKEICETSLEQLFEHIFYRTFNFGEDQEDKITPHKLLKPIEMLDLEGDYPIKWKADDVEFAHKLITAFYDNQKDTDDLLRKISDNWDLERIARIDRILIHIAVAEFIYFPNIPPKVSINESLEIAKAYSTDKSNIFINGVLEKIRIMLQDDVRFKKAGRGLIDH